MNCTNRVRKWWSVGIKVLCGGALIVDRDSSLWRPRPLICARCARLVTLPHQSRRQLINSVDTPTFKRTAYGYVRSRLPDVCYFYETTRGIFSVYANQALRAEGLHPLTVSKPGATIDAAWRQAALILGWKEGVPRNEH